MRRIYVGGRALTVSAYPDFSFRDEWSGIFYLDEKLADYLAVKTSWGWAAPENSVPERTVVRSDGITFLHDVNGHPVRITVKLRQKLVKNRLLENLEIRVSGSEGNVLEMGVCGRHAYDSQCGGSELHVTPLQSEMRTKRALIRIVSDSTASAQDLGPRMHEQGGKTFNIHVVQVPFGESITIEVVPRIPRLLRAVKSFSASFQTDSEEWNEIYRRARETIRILVKRRGWYAGLPWFVQYWARDTFISLPALIREGYAPLARRALLDFLYSAVDGEIPRLIRENGTPEFGSIDANPLFLSAAIDYVLTSRDYEFMSENVTDILEAYQWIRSRFDGLPRSAGKDTWMDTLDFRKYPVEVAAFVENATRKLLQLGLVPEEDLEEIRGLWGAEKKKYLLERSANVLLAAVYGLIPAEEAMQLAKEWRLVTELGVRSWSPLEVEYDPAGYHTGAVWGLTTAAGLYVALKGRDWATANVLLRALLRREKWTMYLDEVWDANTGKPMGADAQLWTAAMVIRTIDEVMIDHRMIPPEITKIRRVRWEKGSPKRISIEK